METVTRRMLRAEEAAERLGISAWRAYELIRANKMPAVRLGRSIRIDAAALERWIENGGTREP